MTTKICRICLRTYVTLRELEEILADHYEDMCDVSSGISKYMCCSDCEGSLRNNLDFKYKCWKSNQILQEWSKNKKTISIHFLHQLIQTSPNDIAIKQESESDHKLIDDTKEQSTDDKHEVITELDKVKETMNEEIKIEIKSEDENVAIIQEEKVITDNYSCYIVLHQEDLLKDTADDSDWSSDEVVNEPVKTKLEFPEDIIYDSDELDDDIESASIENRKDKKIARRNKPKNNQDQQDKRKDSSNYAKYESVFDIKLFESEQEARLEVAQRRVSEPYVSARHRCEVCHTVYKSEAMLRYHMKWHDLPSAEFECDICRMRFPSRQAMTGHKNRSHRGRFACKLCPLITYHESAFIAHSQKHKGKVYKCHCERVFNHITTYLNHKRQSHASAHVCGLCARTFVSQLGLQNHRTRVHKTKSRVDEGTARCEPCGLTFTDQRVYTVHVMNTDRHKDIADTLIACSVCGLQFADKLQVRAHRRQIHPRFNSRVQRITKCRQCPLCGLSGTHSTWLYRHFKTSHPTESYELNVPRDPSKHLCDKCGKSFNNITLLKEHNYAHAGLQPFRCGKCPAKFSSKRGLWLHEERHAPPSRECPECGKKFVSSSNLYNHMRSHVRDRRYKCSLCAKGFIHSASLKEHIRGVHLHIRRERKTREIEPAETTPPHEK